MMCPAVFLGLEGVLVPHALNGVRCLADLVPLPGVEEAMQILSASDYKIFMVTNQGWLETARVLDRARMPAVLERFLMGFPRVDSFRVCVHGKTACCPCRLPNPGMLWSLAGEHNLDLSRSWLIDDYAPNLHAADAVAAQAVLLCPSHAADTKGLHWFVADDLADAVVTMLRNPT